MHPQGSGRGRGAGGRGRRAWPTLRGPLCLLLCAALVVGLVPGSGMAWAAERDLEALAAASKLLRTTDDAADMRQSELVGDGDRDDGYERRLLVSLANDGTPRMDDTVLGEHDGTVLIGFDDDATLEEAKAYYGRHAEWVEEDVPLGMADGEADGLASLDEMPAPVSAQDNALARLSALDAALDEGEDGSGQDGVSVTADEGLDTHPLVALVDTGAPPKGGVQDAVSVLADTDDQPRRHTEDDGAWPQGVRDVNGHATKVLGVMQSEDPDVRVLSVKALDDEGVGTVSSVYAAIIYAVDAGATIVNLSLAGHATQGSVALAEAVRYATEHDVAVVAAAGNGGGDAAEYVPASCDGSLAVGAVDAGGAILETSNRGRRVDLYVEAGSTSLAAARVTGWLSARVPAIPGADGTVRLQADWRESLLMGELNAHADEDLAEAAHVPSAGDSVDAAPATPDGDGQGAGGIPSAEPVIEAADAASALAGRVDTGIAYAALLNTGNAVGGTAYPENTLLFLRLAAAPEDATQLTDVCGNHWVAKESCLWTDFEDVPAAEQGAAPEWGAYSSAVVRVAVAPGQLIRPLATKSWFASFTNASISIDLAGFDLSRVTSMASMFRQCAATSLDLSAVSTPNLTDMSYLFQSCTKLTSLDVSGLDTAKVTNMSNLFDGCTGLTYLDVSNFDGSSVTNMYYTFINLSKLETLVLDDFNVPKLTGLTRTFQGCTKLKNVDFSEFKAPKLTNMYAMFKGCAALTHIDISSCTATGSRSIPFMFEGCSNLETITFNTAGITASNLQCTFNGCSKLSSLDCAKITTNSTTNMEYTFNNCASLTSLDVSGWKTPNVTTMAKMFASCTNLTTLDVSGWDTSRVTTMESMFYNCGKLGTIDVSGWRTPVLTNLKQAFYGCAALTTLDVSAWDASRVTNMSNAFSGCRLVTTLDLSGWRAALVTNMESLFSGCAALEALDLSGWDTSLVTTMKGMLSGCSSLVSLDLGGSFSIASVANATNLPALGDCTALVSMYLGAWAVYNADPTHTQKRSATLPSHTGAASGEGWWDLSAPANPSDAFHAANSSVTPMSGGEAQLFWGSSAPGIYAGYDAQAKTLRIRVAPGAPTGWYADELSSWPSGAAGSESDVQPWYGERLQIEHVVFDGSLGKVRPTSLRCWFYGMANLTSVDLSGLDSSLVTDLRQTFGGCSSLGSVNAAALSTSKVTDMTGLFSGCSSLTALDPSGWDTSLVTSMEGLFSGCAALEALDLSGWNSSQVTTMQDMFSGCTALASLDLGGSFSIASVADAAKLPAFDDCTALASAYLGAWAVYNAEASHAQKRSATLPAHAGAASGEGWWDAEGTQRSASFVPMTSRQAQLMWGTGGVGVYAKLESGTLTFRASAGWPGQPWYETNLADTSSWANGNSRPWYSARTSITGVVFEGRVCPANMSWWFSGLTNLTSVDLSGLDSSLVQGMASTFEGCTKLGSIVGLGSLDTSSVTSMARLFYNCQVLPAADVIGWDTSQVTDMRELFYNCKGLGYLDVFDWDTSKVTDMSSLFRSCSGIVNLDLSRWNTSQVTSMSYLFGSCSALKKVEVSNFDTAQVTSMEGMFYGCTVINGIDVSHFDTGSLVSVAQMFYSCNGLSRLDFSNWQTPQLENMSRMLYGTSNLNTIDLSPLDTSHVTDMTNLLSGGWVYTVKLGGNFSIENVPAGKLPTLTGCTRLTYADMGCFAAYNSDPEHTEKRTFTIPDTSIVTGSNWWDGEGIPRAIGATVTLERISQAVFTNSPIKIYARYSQGTLTFHNGGSVAPYGYYDGDVTSRQEWRSHDAIGTQPWAAERGNVTRVVFDASGGKVRPAWMARWFDSMTSLVEVDAAGLNATDVTSAVGLFSGCSSLRRAELTCFNVSALTNLSELFMGCTGLEEVNLSGFSSSAVTDMHGMFSGCESLTQLDLSPLDTHSATDMTDLLSGCTGIETLELGGNFSIAGVTNDARLPEISGLDALTSVFLGAWVNYNVAHVGSERSVGLPDPVGLPENTAWWDRKGVAHALGSLVAPKDAQEAELHLGTAQAGAYACWNAVARSLTFCVSTGKPGDGWYDDDLYSLVMTSVDDQPWGSVRSQIETVTFDGSGGKVRPQDMAWWLSGLVKLTSVNLTGLDTSQATDLSHLFQGCVLLPSLDLSGVSTARAQAMAGMFQGCDALASVVLGPAFSFKGATSAVLAMLPNPEGESSGTWGRVADAQNVALEADSVTGLTAAALASSYNGSSGMTGTWEADRLVAFGGNGGTGAQARTFSLDRLVTKALSAGMSRAYCGLAGWSATAPASDAADVVPTLAWDATVADARSSS